MKFGHHRFCYFTQTFVDSRKILLISNEFGSLYTDSHGMLFSLWKATTLSLGNGLGAFIIVSNFVRAKNKSLKKQAQLIYVHWEGLCYRTHESCNFFEATARDDRTRENLRARRDFRFAKPIALCSRGNSGQLRGGTRVTLSFIFSLGTGRNFQGHLVFSPFIYCPRFL